MGRKQRALSIQDRSEAIISRLSEGLFERSQVIRLSFAAMVAGESVFLLGPPGTAKSLIARRLSCALTLDDGGELRSFQYLMGRFSTPEELFGPISVQGLKQDQFIRKTEGYLPTAHVAFLDELWKASPAILNTLLTALNERVFRNGVQEEPMPLRALVAASNEVPQAGGGLEALWDRFVLRLWVDNIEDEGTFMQMLSAEEDVYRDPLAAHPELKLSLTELTAWQSRLARLPISPAAADVILSIKQGIEAYNQGRPEEEPPLYISDRRWRKVTRFLKACALLNGHKSIGLSECSLLPYCLWDQPQQLPVLFERCAQALFVSCYGRSFNREALTQELTELKRDLEARTGSRSLGRPLPNHLNKRLDGLCERLRLAQLELGTSAAAYAEQELSGVRLSQPELSGACERGARFRERLMSSLSQTRRHLRALGRKGPSVWSDLDAFAFFPRPAEESVDQALPAGAVRRVTLTPRQVRPFDEEGAKRFGVRWRALRQQGLSFNLVYCPPGRFKMGEGEGGLYAYDEGESYQYAHHELEVTRGFWMGETPVTQALYLAVMGYHRPSQWGREHPVDEVSWYDAAAFCHRLSELCGLDSPYYSRPDRQETLTELDLSRGGFRLPTEAEWVYAAQADHPTRYAGSNHLDGVAWTRKSSQGKMQPVKRLKPNAWGLYDMSGNVRELCLDRVEGGSFHVEREGRHIDHVTSDQVYNCYYLRGGGASLSEHLARPEVGELTEWGFPLTQVGFRVILPA